MVFSTERFVARPWDPDDHAEAAFLMYGDAEVVRYIGNRVMLNIDEQRAHLRAIVERWTAPLPASGTNLKTLSEDVEVGWHVARRYWRRGVATEMGRALLLRGFETLGLERLHAVVDPENLPSQRVALKIGMRHTGRTGIYYDRELEHFELSSDAWHDARPAANSL